MFKKIFLVFTVIIFITSCWETTDSTNLIWWLIKTETNNLFIDIPTNWTIIDDKENILPKANNADIELAVISENMVNWFANNLLILSNELETFTTSKDYSILNNVWAQVDYLDYKKLESKDFTFLDEEKSLLYIFEAKYNLDTPKLKFLQTSHICNQNKAFFLTIAIPTSIRDTSKYEYLLSTFKCK